eukprot:SM000290S10907  [mRNA]  locus=s290:1938:2365:- [translate_table: standard]
MPAWAHVWVTGGTLAGGLLGFYIAHRVEQRHKAAMREKLRTMVLEGDERGVAFGAPHAAANAAEPSVGMGDEQQGAA